MAYVSRHARPPAACSVAPSRCARCPRNWRPRSLRVPPSLHRQISSVVCAAHESTQVVASFKDDALLPAAPLGPRTGALLVREAGGVVRHPDGRDYDLFDASEPTLLSPDEPTWLRARAELFPSSN